MSAPVGPKPAVSRAVSGQNQPNEGRLGLRLAQPQEALLFNQDPDVGPIVVPYSYCCSVVTVNNKNSVQSLTLDSSSSAWPGASVDPI